MLLHKEYGDVTRNAPLCAIVTQCCDVRLNRAL